MLRSFILVSVALPALLAQSDWPSWGRDPGNQRFSPLKQINSSNVSKLVPAWQYQMKKEGQPFRASQSTPLVAGGVMYLSFPFYRVVALEPETGKVLWEYTARGDNDSPEHRTHVNSLGSMRGLAYWRGDKMTPPQIVFGTEDGELYSLNAKTGKPNPGFGNEGVVNLKTPEVMNGFPNMHYGISSAVTVFKNLVFTGTHNADETGSKGPSGDVRAWDLSTGRLVWTFHTVPRPGEVGHESWPGDSWKNVSGANVWTFFTLDEKRGILYMPLGSAQNDYYGVDRPGNNLFANSIVAVDAETGKLKWYFQAVHHDLWDFDMPVPPILFDVVKDGKRIPAVGVMTKMPLLFILDRVTGKPIYGVEERPVPPGDVPGEYYSPTQPFPVKPPPLGRLSFSMDDIAKVTPEHEAACRELLFKEDGGRNRGPYTPPSEKGALVMPAPGGGAEFTGGAFDPNLGYYIINTADTGQISVIQRRDVDLDMLPAYLKPRWTGPPESPLLYLHPAGPPVAVKGWPCWQPPWSRLTAVNVSTGEIAWQIPFGTVDDAPPGMKTGAPTSHVGGPTATAGGLIFIGAATDRLFRAFDTRTGQELWSVKTPELIRGANPITYMGKDGKQYVAVAAGTDLLTYKLP
ncbi:MAG: pyrroloquinoline quinone-dependent dehydrogenase [Acidobacteriota bacterium]